MIVAVGRFTPTDSSPGETAAPWEAFGFDSRKALDDWLNDYGLWYPDAIICKVRWPKVAS